MSKSNSCYLFLASLVYTIDRLIMCTYVNKMYSTIIACLKTKDPSARVRQKGDVFDRSHHTGSIKWSKSKFLDLELMEISVRLAIVTNLSTELLYSKLSSMKKVEYLNFTKLGFISKSSAYRLALFLSLIILLSGDVHLNPGPLYAPPCESDFKIASLNTRSIKRVDYVKDKLTEFKTMCQIIDPDIFVITESWLKDFIDNNEVIGETYQIHRQDRKGKGGGGILILVKSEYFSEERPDLKSPSLAANEILSVEVRNNKGQKLLIVGAYRPDSVTLYNFVPNLDFTLCNAYLTGFTDIIVTGDFNTRNITWNEQSDTDLGPQDLDFSLLL